MGTYLEKKNEYEICNYIYHELPNGDLVVQNSAGIVRINDPILRSKIIEWDTKTTSVIDNNIFIKEFQNRSEQAIEFLLKYKIIKEKIVPNFSINRVNIITNSNLFYNNMSDLSHDFTDKLTLRFTNIKERELEDNSIDNNELVIIFLNPYSKTIAKKILDYASNKKNTVTLFSYVYNNSMYIDSLYSKKWYKPCHFCHIGHIETQLRVNESGSMTYQQIIESLYYEDSSFKVESSLKKMDIYLLVHTIGRIINKFIIRDDQYLYNHESLEDMNKSYVINLKTKEISDDFSIFWEMCNCYE